jgi:uncharacterized repeat protein (TIGR04138 family)
MHESEFLKAVKRIHKEDPRYAPDAYVFIREALDYTVKMLDKPADGPGRHVTGHELLDGVRTFALQEFGPMALTLLARWGVKSTEDIGEMVFHLVGTGLLGKTDGDSKEDFAGGYDFHQAFAAPFLPAAAAPPPPEPPAPARQEPRAPRRPRRPEDRP